MVKGASGSEVGAGVKKGCLIAPTKTPRYRRRPILHRGSSTRSASCCELHVTHQQLRSRCLEGPSTTTTRPRHRVQTASRRDVRAASVRPGTSKPHHSECAPWRILAALAHDAGLARQHWHVRCAAVARPNALPARLGIRLVDPVLDLPAYNAGMQICSADGSAPTGEDEPGFKHQRPNHQRPMTTSNKDIKSRLQRRLVRKEPTNSQYLSLHLFPRRRRP